MEISGASVTMFVQSASRALPFFPLLFRVVVFQKKGWVKPPQGSTR
jgi:hypothetical protein